MNQTAPEVREVEVSYPVYDNMPIGPGSHPPQNVQNHWRVHIGRVSQPEREKRLLEAPMEQILANCGPYPPTTHEQTLKLARGAEGGDPEARERLILHFQRFVVWVAKSYIPQAKRLHVPVEDVVQDGMVGLIKAAGRVDTEIAANIEGSVPSYFRYSITGSISRGLADTSRLIRLPTHLQTEARSLVKVSSALRAELGREPTTQEIADRAGMIPPNPPELIGIDESQEYDEFHAPRPEYVINRTRAEHARAVQEAIDRVEPILRAERRTLSLDAFARDRAGKIRPLHEMIEDEDSELTLMEQVSRDLQRENIDKAFDDLPDRARLILEMRYGLEGDEPATLRDIAKTLGVSLERVRQIIDKSQKKLKRSGELQSSLESDEDFPRYRWRQRTYLDHVGDIAQFKNASDWLQLEIDDVEFQRSSHIRQEVKKRRAENAVVNVEENLRRLAGGYIARCEEGSLYLGTPNDESMFISEHHYETGAEEPIDKHFENQKNRQQDLKVLRRYAGLAAFMALSLKSPEMSHVKAWRIARHTLFGVVQNFNHDNDRLADVYCAATEKAFASAN